jgi:hypothetical protein
MNTTQLNDCDRRAESSAKAVLDQIRTNARRLTAAGVSLGSETSYEEVRAIAESLGLNEEAFLKAQIYIKEVGRVMAERFLRTTA